GTEARSGACGRSPAGTAGPRERRAGCSSRPGRTTRVTVCSEGSRPTVPDNPRSDEEGAEFVRPLFAWRDDATRASVSPSSEERKRMSGPDVAERATPLQAG